MKKELIKSSQTKSLEAFSLDSNESIKITTIHQAVTSKTPTLNKLTKEGNQEKTSYIIMGLLVSLNSKLKLKEKLTENEIRRLSESILAKYSSLKIADIIYVFNQIADGEIDLFGSLSHRDIMKALYDYNKTRWKHKNY
jgi:hypothetical protein